MKKGEAFTKRIMVEVVSIMLTVQTDIIDHQEAYSGWDKNGLETILNQHLQRPPLADGALFLTG